MCFIFLSKIAILYIQQIYYFFVIKYKYELIFELGLKTLFLVKNKQTQCNIKINDLIKWIRYIFFVLVVVSKSGRFYESLFFLFPIHPNYLIFL